MKEYYSLDELLNMIEEPNKSSCKKVYLINEVKFELAKGSEFKHQSWIGGYLDHIKEVMNIAVPLYEMLNSRRKQEFSLSDALLVLYLHDLEKAWKYGGNEDEAYDALRFKNNYDFILYQASKHDFKLTTEHLNALKYVHGEGSDYDKKRNVMGTLAGFVHICDIASSRIWHEYPKKSGDTWATNE
ncbi:MAG: hypothetical protein Q8Q04_02095 [archaeon]|nr:hypothetical protein [archaeon]